MKYYTPETIADAAASLREEEDPQIIAGGQSMMPLLRQGLVSPSALVDVTAIADIDGVTVTDGTVTIGAAVRYAALLEHKICRRLDLLRESLEAIGDKQVRNAGTIGGGIAHGDPAQDLPPALQCYDAVVNAAPSGVSYELTDFYIDFYRTELSPEEVLVSVQFDLPPQEAGGSFHKHAQTPGGYSEAGIAALVIPGKTDYEDVRVAYCAGGPTPQRIPAEIEQFLENGLNQDRIVKAGDRLVDSLDLVVDVGDESVEHTERLFRVLLKRALRTATERSSGPAAANL